jgi:hypothetical protein
MLPSLTRMGVIGNYWIQFQTYSEELCENIDKPELSCNGKCQMMQELNHAEKTPPFTSPQTLTFKEQPAVISSVFSMLIFKSDDQTSWFSDYSTALQKGVSMNVFHPPC